MAETIDCSGFCRLCLVKEQVNTPIFEESGDLQQIYLKITACLPIKVSIEDPLPKRICDDCSYKLEQQYQFWNTILNSEKQLKQWLGLPDEPPPPTKSETSNGVKREKDNYETAPKRPRRNARKAAQNVRQAAAAAIAASDSGPGEDMDLDTFGAKEKHDTDNDLNDSTEPLTESTYMNVVLDSEEATEAGPSGLQKNANASGNANQDASGTGEPTRDVNNKRLDYLDWTEYFMATAFLAAMRSKDPVTQVGACIVNEENKIIGIGYNSMPKVCSDDIFPWSKESIRKLERKKLYVCHAEVNAILNKNSADVKNCTLYVALFPCNECAKIIIQSGIREVVYLSNKLAGKVSTIASERMLIAAGVKYRQYIPKKKQIMIDFNKIDRN